MPAWLRCPDRRVLLLAALVVAGCGGTATVALDRLDRTRAVLADGTELCLLVAASAAQRAQGLKGAGPGDLAGADGMVFRYPEPATVRFHMRGTVMALDIAFLDGDGTVVATDEMVPCPTAQDCPTYGSDRPFLTAIETPADRVELQPGDVVAVGGSC
jgi:uncharacterized membrane protein (UPF0127 family)